MLLYLLLSATEPGNAVELPPATDPTGRLIALALAFLAVAGPYATAKVSAKKGVSNGPTPLNGSSSSPLPRLDERADYLKIYMGGLEREVETLKALNAEQQKQILELTRVSATSIAQNEALRADIAGLREEIHELRGQLRGRGSGR